MTSFTIFYFDVFFWHGKSLYICITKAFAVLLHAINLQQKQTCYNNNIKKQSNPFWFSILVSVSLSCFLSLTCCVLRCQMPLDVSMARTTQSGV